MTWRNLLLGVAVVAGLAVLTVVFTRPRIDLERVGIRETLAHGEGQRGPWKVTGSWTPWQSCILVTEVTAEGGACGLARPGTLNESTSFLVDDQGDPLTIVAGPVPPDTARIVVTVTDGETFDALIQRAGFDRFFVVELPGRRSVAGITALDGDGDIVGRLEHGPKPPPGSPTDGLPGRPPPPARLPPPPPPPNAVP